MTAEAPAMSFTQRVKEIQRSVQRVYAPLSLGWRDTKQSMGEMSSRLGDRFRAAPPLVRVGVMFAVIALVFSLPQLTFMTAFYRTILVDQMAFYVLLALGLNVVVGFAGLLALGYVAFYAIGAYVAAYITGVAPVQPPEWLPNDPFLTFPFAIVICMLFGVVLGLPTLRLRGDYLAIVTLGFHEIVRLTLKNSDPYTNGDRGIRAIPHFEIPQAAGANYLVALLVLGGLIALLGLLIAWRGGRGNRALGVGFVVVGAILAALAPLIHESIASFGQRFADFGLDPVPYYYLAVVISIGMIFMVHRLSESRVGRGWVAIREDEIAAEAMGVPTLRLKVLAFAIGASTAGFAGVMLAIKTSFINPQYFILLQSIIVLAMVVFGGMGSIAGAIAGAVFIGFAQAALRDVDVVPFQQIFLFFAGLIVLMGVLVATNIIKTRAGRAYGFWLIGIGVVLAAASPLFNIPFERIAQRPDDWRLFILGVILVIVMILRPQGLIPSRRRAAELSGEATSASEALATSELDTPSATPTYESDLPRQQP